MMESRRVSCRDSDVAKISRDFINACAVRSTLTLCREQHLSVHQGTSNHLQHCLVSCSRAADYTTLNMHPPEDPCTEYGRAEEHPKAQVHFWGQRGSTTYFSGFSPHITRVLRQLGQGHRCEVIKSPLLPLGKRSRIAIVPHCL